jgi:basic amino acid/polyamine antiporter, APA family
MGFFDATSIVMGGIVRSGIFINPYVVARHVHTPFSILGVWLAGGALHPAPFQQRYRQGNPRLD